MTPMDRRRRWYDNHLAAGAAILGMMALLLGPIAVFINVMGGSARSFNLPAASMEPALRVGEYAFADMAAYTTRAPERGDVVVFRSPLRPGVHFVKRIVGLPGERIHFVRGVLLINGAPAQYGPAGEYTPTAPSGEPSSRPIAAFVETLPNGRSYTVMVTPEGFGANAPSVTVPSGHYFVAGDNRDNSLDSRGAPGTGLGFIPSRGIEGQFTYIYWPSTWSRLFSKVR